MSSTIFNQSIVWQSKFDSESWLYMMGITQTTYNYATLLNSQNTDYDDNTAYYLISQDTGSIGRRIVLSSSDTITITGAPNNNAFGIDEANNLLIFDPDYPVTSATSVSVKVVKNVASIWKRNQERPQFLIDFTYQNERAILSVVSSDEGLFLGGVSGKIWFYDGIRIKEVYQFANSGVLKPVSALCIHQFAHETIPYLYAGSSDDTSLFRAELAEAQYGNTWEAVGDLSNPGVNCMASAFNKLFLGMKNNQFGIYSRIPESKLNPPESFLSDANEQVIIETESTEVHILTPDNIEDYDRETFDIQCFEVGHNQLFAGISNRPEVWSYSEVKINNPLNDEEWGMQIFDRSFIDDPSPAQFYTQGGVTNSRFHSNVNHQFLYDLSNPSKVKDLMLITGVANAETAFEFTTGSDWEQVLDKTSTQLAFNEVDCASTGNVSLTNTVLPIIDGFQTAINSTVLLKDQTTESQNGIYKVAFSGGSYNLVRASFNTASSVRVGFIIKNGSINSNTRYLIDTNDVYLGNFNFYKPQHTIELDLFNAGYKKYSNEDAEPYWIGFANNFANNSYVDLIEDIKRGYQGIEVSDGYRQYKLEFNFQKIKLSSGNSQAIIDLPRFGFLKNWNFYDARTTSDWEIGGLIEALSVVEQNEYTVDNVAKKTQVLFLETLGATGNPYILNSSVNVEVNSNTKVFVKLKINAQSGYTISKGQIRLSWSYKNQQFENWSGVDIKNSSDYVLYEISPAWHGSISQIAIEFNGLSEDSSRPTNAYIDYVQIINKDSFFDINLFPSKVRITVQDKDIQVWAGNQDYPILDYKNFIVADTFKTSISDYDRPKIKIGKLTPTDDDSLFGYTQLRFIAGGTYNPNSKKVLNLHNSWRFPSAGGTRILTFHNGTLYAICDGLNTNRFSDNPDDRQIKIFYYSPDKEIWIKENSSFERKIQSNTGDVLGIVRALTAKSFDNAFYLSGQYSSIKYNQNR